MEAELERLLEQSMKIYISTLPLLQAELFHRLNEESEDGLETFLKVFKEKTTHSDKLLCMYEKLGRCNLLEEKYIADCKSDIKATKRKEKGNRFFAKKKYSEALKCYNRALVMAEDQELLSILYANRSAVSFHLELYEECLTDIKRAIANNYPKRLKPKVILRKTQAAEKLREESENRPNVHEAVPTFPTNLRNPTMPCATKSVEIKTCRTGKKVVATKPIHIGEVIAVEEPLIAMIGEAKLSHCHECFTLCYNPIPCSGCTQTLYCSEACKDKALLSHHKYECPILLSLRKLMGTSGGLVLAAKMLLQTVGQLSDEVFHLIQKVQNEEFSEQLQLEIAAAVMYDLVKKHTEKFQGPRGEANEESFKKYIVPLLQVCILQVSGVDELCPLNDGIGTFLGHETVAVAIYPFYGTCRHACGPNVFPNHYGVKKVLRAIRTIKKGREVLVSFGPHYVEDTKEDRQARLSAQYHFKCTCRPCNKNWTQVGDPALRPADVAFTYTMIRAADVELAKSTVPKKIKTMKRLERDEPNLDLTYQQKILLHCYDVLGNKRMIL